MKSFLTLSVYNTVVVAEVDQPFYFAEEMTGFVTVCVRISGDALARPVIVTVRTENSTAQGMEYETQALLCVCVL